MNVEALITTYGYAAVAVGAFMEGEAVLVLGGFAAQRGYLSFPWVVLVAFAATFAGDQFFFYLGRWKGAAFVDARPGWRHRADRVRALIYRRQVPIILIFRFVYGFRILTPVLLGASRVSPVRFAPLNAVGGLVWAMTIGALGYLFGHAMEVFLEDVRRYEFLIMACVVAATVLIWGLRFWRKRGRR